MIFVFFLQMKAFQSAQTFCEGFFLPVIGFRVYGTEKIFNCAGTSIRIHTAPGNGLKLRRQPVAKCHSQWHCQLQGILQKLYHPGQMKAYESLGKAIIIFLVAG